MKNDAIISITAILIAGLVLGTATTVTYVYVENERSDDITPEEVISSTEPAPEYIGANNVGTSEKIVKDEVTNEEVSVSLVKEKITSLTDYDLSKYNICFEELNIKVYGLNYIDSETTLQRYREKMEKDGYEIIREEERNEYNVFARGIFGKSTLHGRGIVVISGEPVTTHFGYDTMVITSNGYLTSYKKCAEAVGIEL